MDFRIGDSCRVVDSGGSHVLKQTIGPKQGSDGEAKYWLEPVVELAHNYG